LNHYKFGNSSSNKLINEVLKRGSECGGTNNASTLILQPEKGMRRAKLVLMDFCRSLYV